MLLATFQSEKLGLALASDRLCRDTRTVRRRQVTGNCSLVISSTLDYRYIRSSFSKIARAEVLFLVRERYFAHV